MSNDEVFNNLRQKLDVLGYHQPLPLGAVSLVGALFEDLIKTTESLRDAKFQLSNLLEEKSCWELGVEPYKCDNSRLLAECNALHLDLIKQREEFEEQICDYAKKIRNLESDKRCLEDHCVELESQIRDLVLRYSDAKTLKSKKDGVNMSKKPFISTVKAGVLLPNPGQDHHHPTKCTKCNNIVWTKQSGGSTNSDIERLQNDVREKSDQVALYKKKVEERDREIRRLNDLLTGGRPPAALAKDCCYKNVGSLSEDVEKLQKEKVENHRVIREIQESMHEAKQRAVDLAERNKKLERELRELKDTALCVEQQANEEITKKEYEISKLCEEIKRLRKQKVENAGVRSPDRSQRSADEKRRLNERLNELILKEKDLEAEIDRLMKKNVKLKNRVAVLEKESDERLNKQDKSVLTELDEERIRLKSERDLFQKEYLRLVEKSGSPTEVCYLRTQLKEKEDELNNLRTEICQLRAQASRTSYEKCSPSPSISVQATILRAERERDAVKAELDRVKTERDALREKLQFSTEAQLTETDRFSREIQQLKVKICKLEKENRDLLSAQIPGQTHITLMREEIEELKKRVMELQTENCRLNTTHNQLKILHEQTERALVEYQNKLAISETNLRNAESRLGAFSTNRDTARSEVYALRNEVTVLKTTNNTLEQEKDKFMAELDLKTEKLYRMENEVKTLRRKKDDLESTVHELQDKLDKVTSERKERETELHETSTESKTLRQQINTLKEIRDQAIAENSRLSNELADAKAEICLTVKKLKDSEKEVERLKQQLQQYVQKVKRAEDLLMQKECEREEMLDHYRTLSHDAIVLEGNNQSLEMEAAEHKRQLLEAEAEVSRLKQELAIKNCTIDKLEKQITVLSSQICSLERDLEQAYDDQKLLKADLDAMKELCEKLDLQSEKQNAELQERGEIISKLEKDISEMRKQLTSSSTSDKAATDMLQDLLAKSRQELESERKAMCKLAQEKLDLRKKLEEMQKKLEEEREKAAQKEALAKEYSVQIQEMQHNLTDDRFQKARSREESPRSSKFRLSSGFSPSPSQGNDFPGCTSGARGLYTNSTYCVDSNTASNMNSNASSNICSNIDRNIYSTDIPSSIGPNVCPGGARTSTFNRQEYPVYSSNKSSVKSSPGRSKKDDSLKCVKTVLKGVPPCRRSDLVKDVNKFLKKDGAGCSYNEKVSFDEDKDDIIVRRTRNVKTAKVEPCKRSRDDTWATILSSTSKSSRCSPEKRKLKHDSECRTPTFFGAALKTKKSSSHDSRKKSGERNLNPKEKTRSIYIPTVPLKAHIEKKCTKPTPPKTKEIVDKKCKSRESSPSKRVSKDVKPEQICPKIYQMRPETLAPEGLKVKPYVKKDPKKEIQDTINTTLLQKKRDSICPIEINTKPKKTATIELQKAKVELASVEVKGKTSEDIIMGKSSRKYNFLPEKVKEESKPEIKPKFNVKIEHTPKRIKDEREPVVKPKPAPVEVRGKTSGDIKIGKSLRKYNFLPEKVKEESKPEIRPKFNVKTEGKPRRINEEREPVMKTEAKPKIIKQEPEPEKKPIFHPEIEATAKKVEFAPEKKFRINIKTEPELKKIKAEPPVNKIKKENQDNENDIKPKIKTEPGIKKEDIKEEDMDDEYFDVYGLAPGPRGYDDYYYESNEPSAFSMDTSAQTEPDTIEISDEPEDKWNVKKEPPAKLKKEPSDTKPFVNIKKEASPEPKLKVKTEIVKFADDPSATLPAHYDLPQYEDFSPKATSSLEEETTKVTPPASDLPQTSPSDGKSSILPERDQPPASASDEKDAQHSVVPTRILPPLKKRRTPPRPFKGCVCMQHRYDKLRRLINGNSSITSLNKTAYYRRSIICKRSNNRIEQTLLLESGGSRTSQTLGFDTSCLPPPPKYDRCRKQK